MTTMMMMPEMTYVHREELLKTQQSSTDMFMEEQHHPQIHFEGPEKRLLIWYNAINNNKKNHVNDETREEPHTLRTLISKTMWVDMLHKIGCEILSVQSSKSIDAYVLSESSLFVYDRFMMIKTCGQTTLLNILAPMQEVTKGTLEMARMLFSRKNYLAPEEQHTMHKTWEAEREILDRYFGQEPTENPYAKSSVNGTNGQVKVATSHAKECQDAWYTYHWQKQKVENDKTDSGKRAYPITFEVLMHDLPQSSMAHFFEKNIPKQVAKGTAQGEYVTVRSGIDKLIKGTHIDPFQFEPCGYSMNGLVGNDHYSTIHITPEDFCSYASFETNYSGDSNDSHAVATFYKNLVHRVLNVFAPGRFMITMFDPNTKTTKVNIPTMKPYKCTSKNTWFNGLVHASSYTTINQRAHCLLDDHEEKVQFFESTSSDDE